MCHKKSVIKYGSLSVTKDLLQRISIQYRCNTTQKLLVSVNINPNISQNVLKRAMSRLFAYLAASLAQQVQRAASDDAREGSHKRSCNV